ncbi:g11767 [Coccomyxa elongata]
MPLKDSGVANTALSAAGMSWRVSRRVDVGPEHLQPLDDVEVGPGPMSPARREIGSLMMGTKLTMSEYLTAWLAVFLFTLATILSFMGNVLLSYFNQQISQDIGMTDAQYGMLTGYAYYLLLSVAMVIQGYVIDKYSLNRMYVVGFGGVLGAAGLLMQGFAKDFNMMLVGMLVSALGSSVFQILPIPILSDVLPPEQLSFGGAIATCGGYAAWLVAGNLADLCLKKGISWHWAVVGLSAGCGVSSLAILAFLREPPVGRFIVKKEGKDRPQKPAFSIKQVVLYMVSMSSMWILTIATGLRNIPEDWSGAYMPSYYSAEYPDQKTVFTAMSIIISLGGLSASFIYGAVCQRYYTQLPTISLYTTAIGALIAAGCLAMSVTSHLIAGNDSDKGYAIAMTGLALLVLFGEGWQGPLSVMVTLALPPEIKSFAVSLFFALAQLIGPSGTVLYGIYLTAGGWVKGTPEYIAPARIYMLVCMMGGYISSAALYFAAIPAIKHDIAKREAVVRAGGLPQITLHRWRKITFIAGTALLSTAIAILILISLMFSYDPNMIMHPHVHHLG